MKPIDIRPVGEGELLIAWDDQHRSLYGCDYLRANCHCAGCMDEMTGARIVKASAIPKDIHVLKMETVGNYAVRFKWSDGHETGIYSFDLLRALCPCPVCTRNPQISGKGSV